MPKAHPEGMRLPIHEVVLNLAAALRGLPSVPGSPQPNPLLPQPVLAKRAKSGQRFPVLDTVGSGLAGDNVAQMRP